MVTGLTRAVRWRIHHNHFVEATDDTFPNSKPSTIRFLEVEDFDFHHNELGLENAGGVWFTTSRGISARSRFYNNIIYGTNTGTGLDISNAINVDVENNTILISTGGERSACVAVGWIWARESVVRNNILINLVGGPPLKVSTDAAYFYVTDYNIYWTLQSLSLISRIHVGFNYTDLSAWQADTGFDLHSLQTDPIFEDASMLPEGLKLRRESPAIGMAVNVSPWITDDFEGTPRLPKASVGAYEGMPRVKFRTFSTGCAGSGGQVPAIGSAGLRRWGSADFAVTLDNALGGPGVLASMVIGTSNTEWSGVPLPFDLGDGCNLLVSPQAIFGVAVGGGVGPDAGTANFNIPIPVDPNLEGRTIYFQWGVMDPGAGVSGLAVSNGASLQL